jgi:hypothetical protein
MSGKILPFQQLSTRKRKDVNEGTVTVQVCVFAFDILFLNGESLLKVPCVCVCVCVCARARFSSLSRARSSAHSFLCLYMSLSILPSGSVIPCPAPLPLHTESLLGAEYIAFTSGLSLVLNEANASLNVLPCRSRWRFAAKSCARHLRLRRAKCSLPHARMRRTLRRSSRF